MNNLPQSDYTSNQSTANMLFISKTISPSVDNTSRTGGSNVVYLFDKDTSTEIKSICEQLAAIQKVLGLNRLALASVLQVSRPTLYEWLNSKKSTLHKKNQERLDSLYEISKKWKCKNLGLVNGYLHKPIGAAQHSLFSLLKSDELNISEINKSLTEIETFITKKQKKDKLHEALLLQHGFEPVSQEKIQNNLDDLFFRN